MAFTQDELQSLNTIMEQKLAAQRQELEQGFEQRMQALSADFEQHMADCYNRQQQFLQAIAHDIQEQQLQTQKTLHQEFVQQNTMTVQAVLQELKQHEQSSDAAVEQSLAAHLLAVEQLLNQGLARAGNDNIANYIAMSGTPDFDAIEVQTEIPWDELVEMIDNRLDERFAVLKTSLLSAQKEVERYLVLQIHMLRDALMQGHAFQRTAVNESGELTNIQDVFSSIEQLEHLIEAMQVAMTANSALLSNRLYHHQNLPLERVHPPHPLSESSLQKSESTTTDEVSAFTAE